jgi:hypothetical protein
MSGGPFRCAGSKRAPTMSQVWGMVWLFGRTGQSQPAAVQINLYSSQTTTNRTTTVEMDNPLRTIRPFVSVAMAARL